MNCFTVLGIEPTTEKKKIKRAYAAKSREFHPEEHPEEFQRIHDAYEEALAWAERNVESEVGQQMPEEPRQMEMGAAEQEKAGSMQSPTCSRRPMSLTLCWTVKANCCATAGACWNGWAMRSRW